MTSSGVDDDLISTLRILNLLETPRMTAYVQVVERDGGSGERVVQNVLGLVLDDLVQEFI